MVPPLEVNHAVKALRCCSSVSAFIFIGVFVVFKSCGLWLFEFSSYLLLFSYGAESILIEIILNFLTTAPRNIDVK